MTNFSKQKYSIDETMNRAIQSVVGQTTFEIDMWERQELINDFTPEDLMVKAAFKGK